MIRITLEKPGAREERYYSLLSGILMALVFSFGRWNRITVDFLTRRAIADEIFLKDL